MGIGNIYWDPDSMYKCQSATQRYQQGGKIAASICINSELAKQLSI